MANAWLAHDPPPRCRWAGELPRSPGAVLIHNSAPDWVASTATLESISEYSDYWCALTAVSWGRSEGRVCRQG